MDEFQTWRMAPTEWQRKTLFNLVNVKTGRNYPKLEDVEEDNIGSSLLEGTATNESFCALLQQWRKKDDFVEIW